MFRFVPDNVGGVGSKRKHAPKSCETCKKRHKRCSHTIAPSTASTAATAADDRPGSADESGTSEPVAQDVIRTSPKTTASTQVDRRHQLALPPATTGPGRQPASQGAYLRFVGDLSPEASFLITNQNRQSGAQKQRAEIGVWLGQRPEDAPPSDDQDPSIHIEPTSSPSFRLDGLPGLKAIYPYLRKECMTVLPPDYEFSLISNLYFAKFDPIFPILNGEDFDGHDPLDAIVLKQGICLVAAMDPSLRMHLRLPHTEAVLSQTEFRSHIATALKQALDAGFVRHQMVLLQVTALMAFYVDRPSSSEISSHYTAQAVGLSQTLGLHLGWPSNGVSTNKASRIFWCIWTLDRLNAATNGRPIMIHRQDMDKRVLDSVEEQLPSFRLFIRISKLLDETISQYRPSSALENTVTSIDMSHTFERFVREVGAGDVGSALLASLELFYLAVVILQSRPEQPDADGGRVPSSNLQSFCALSVVTICSEEFKSSMTFWPVVPYAVSMAASAAYKSLRNSCLPYKRKQAYTVFYSSCDILDELSKSFISARAMAQLAKDTLQEVERVSSHRNRTKPQHRESQAGQEQARETASDSTATVGNPLTATDDNGDPAEPPTAEAVVPMDPRGMPDAIPGPFDPSIFGGVDMDDVGGIFNDFDPGFHLHRVDAVFSANLNPTMPFFPEHWMEGGPFDSYP